MNTKEYRINLILNNKAYNDYQKENDNCEIDRSFCKHNIQHSLDVARIAYIRNLEDGCKLPKDIVYAAALLHDIGKWKQYKDGTSHNFTGAELAKIILDECMYNNEEVNLIADAILSHCNEVKESKSLAYILYYADKKSRSCFICDSLEYCKWGNEKKNHQIIY